MRIHATLHDSIVDGPGLRFVVFVQGCPHRCAGCHNPQTHDPQGGREVAVEDIVQDMKRNPLLDGITLTGGEPFMQAQDCAEIAKAAREIGLSVWCYSGWTLCELRQMPEAQVLLNEIDVLVDGPYIKEQRSLSLKWRGSENQRVIAMRGCTEKGDL